MIRRLLLSLPLLSIICFNSRSLGQGVGGPFHQIRVGGKGGYDSLILGDHPVMYLGQAPVNGTTWNDRSQNGNNGTLTGGYTLNQPGPLARAVNGGGGVLLNGMSGYVDCGTASTLNPPALTMECWVKFTSLAHAYNGCVSHSNGFTSYQQILVKSSGKLAPYVKCASGDAFYDGTGTATLVVGTWYHLALTYNSTVGLVGYANGVVDGTAGAKGAIVASTVTLSIGTDLGTAGRFLIGSISLPAIYPTALTANQIYAHWAAGFRGYSQVLNLHDGEFNFSNDFGSLCEAWMRDRDPIKLRRAA